MEIPSIRTVTRVGSSVARLSGSFKLSSSV
jgi:hypothetical protein